MNNMASEPSPLSLRFSEALHTAAELHATQVRKGTRIPYIAHLLGVTSIALQYGADEEEAIAALLHDSIEDAPRELGADSVRKLLRFRFGERVLKIVEGCTDTDVSPKPPWRVRKEAYVNRVSNESASVLLVSASDKLHNANSVLHDYRQIGDELWKRFNREQENRERSGTTADW